MPGAAAASSSRTIELVLCRLHAEDVSWAARAQAQVYVYNHGSALTLAPELATKFTVRKLKKGGHESYCYLEHMQRAMKGGNVAHATVFSPAMPRCFTLGPSLHCTSHLLDVVRDISLPGTKVEPHGYAPIEPSPVAPFWYQLPRSLTCLPSAYSQLSQGHDLDTDSEMMSFSPMGSFVVSRKNLLNVPRGWLRRAYEDLHNATHTGRPRLHLCCAEGRTCTPWLLERIWPTLLGTPHRGCNGVRTGYCANEWNVARPQAAAAKAASKSDALALSATPPVGAGALKLRMDVARVARVARFANDLTEEERDTFNELIAAERAQSKGKEPVCSTQLCAIVAILDKARAKDEDDFAVYLASSVNQSIVDAENIPERSQKRCRQLFLDVRVLDQGVPRVQLAGAKKRAAQRSAEQEEHAGEVLHNAIRKVYLACLKQMDDDPRWYQRPFVYGFAQEDPQPLPTGL